MHKEKNSLRKNTAYDWLNIYFRLSRVARKQTNQPSIQTVATNVVTLNGARTPMNTIERQGDPEDNLTLETVAIILGRPGWCRRNILRVIGLHGIPTIRAGRRELLKRATLPDLERAMTKLRVQKTLPVVPTNPGPPTQSAEEKSQKRRTVTGKTTESILERTRRELEAERERRRAKRGKRPS